MSHGQKLLALVKRRHPMYVAMKPQWDFMESTYAGGRAWFSTNIFRYHKEGDQEYRERIERAYRFNHTREVVDLVNKYLYRAKPARKPDVPETLQAFWSNVDGKGTDIDDWARQVSLKASILGCPWVVVDNGLTDVPENASKAEIETLRAERRRAGLRADPYAYLVRPQQVLDMAYGDDGQLLWILIEEMQRDDADPFDSSGRLKPRWRLWTRTHAYLVEAQGTRRTLAENRLMISARAHQLGVVPVLRADNLPSDDPWHSMALINDIAYLDRATANYLSALDVIIMDQTFSQLAIPAQGLMPGEDAYKKVVEMGSNRVFVYDGEHGAAPHFLSPDPRQAQLIIGAIQQVINEIYHSVGLAGERTKQDNAKGIDNSSGVAKAKDFERVNALLVSKAGAMQSLENRVADLVLRWSGEDPDSGKDYVRYGETFEVRGLLDELDLCQRLAASQMPGILRAEHAKGMVSKLFPAMSEANQRRIEKALDTWATEIEERASTVPAVPNSEAKRNRLASGAKQSKTKERRETGA